MVVIMVAIESSVPLVSHPCARGPGIVGFDGRHRIGRAHTAALNNYEDDLSPLRTGFSVKCHDDSAMAHSHIGSSPNRE
ncbi:hypothetical protein U1Q18_049828 [Sarracenia purpurea var. burkii]